jgi:thiol-disulfide isomerase/thioredoxin
MRHRRPSAPAAASVALAAVALLAALAAACGAGPPPRPESSEAGGPGPVFRLASLDGGEIGPEDYPGKVVLLEFWATWCLPCHAQADILEPLYAEYRGRGVEFLAVGLGEDEEVVRRFVARNPFPYPVLIDPADELSYELGIAALPTLMVIDRDGRVAYFEAGVVEEDDLRRLLDDAGAKA